MTRLSLLVIALAACTSSYADEPPGRRFEHDMVARMHMHENYELYSAIEHLLIHGKLADARDLARSIGIAPDEAGLTAYATQTAVVRDRAMSLANATNLDDATRSAARLAAACASCHVATNAVPELRAPPPLPPDKPTVDARMSRHLWAITRVREGMIGGLDEPWGAGLDVLAQSPLPWPAEDSERAKLARRIHEVALHAKARTNDATADRAVSYGELLSTCASCHTVADKQPH
jgi:cytochrome c553